MYSRYQSGGCEVPETIPVAFWMAGVEEVKKNWTCLRWDENERKESTERMPKFAKTHDSLAATSDQARAWSFIGHCSKTSCTNEWNGARAGSLLEPSIE